jgi:Tol biopolymer transport system component
MTAAAPAALAITLTAAVAGLVSADRSGLVVSAHGQTPAGPGMARIAFSSQGRITTMAADGSDRVQLTAGADHEAGIRGDGQPAPAPDGTAIAFTRELADDRHFSRTRIYVMDADGSEQRPLTSGGDDEQHSPAFSPHGSQVAFATVGDTGAFGASTISIVGADGQGERALVVKRNTRRSVAFLSDPAWSPDGDRILYTRFSYREDGEVVPSIHFIDLTSGVTDRLRPKAGDPSFSPDGSLIAFTSTRDENGERCSSDHCYHAPELYVMRSDGTALTRLTTNKGAEANPAWSPDGERIVFSSDRNWPSSRNPEIHSIAPDGSCLTWLTNGTATSVGAAWLPPSAPSAPAACGDPGRPPLAEVGVRGVATGRDYEPLWLGERFRRHMLSDVSRGGAELIFDYSDCFAFEPRDCGPNAYVVSTSICSRSAYLGLTAIPARFRAQRGVLTANVQGAGGLHAYAGGAELFVVADGPWGAREGHRKERKLIDHLEPVRGRSARHLPASVLPRGLVRRARSIVTDVRQTGSYRAAAARSDVNLVTVTNSIRLLQALRELDRMRTRRC